MGNDRCTFVHRAKFEHPKAKASDRLTPASAGREPETTMVLVWKLKNGASRRFAEHIAEDQMHSFDWDECLLRSEAPCLCLQVRISV